MNNHIQQYISKGFAPVQVNTSCIAGQVLTDGNIAVKFGQDSSYHEYIDYLQNQAPKLNCWPIIHSHDIPLGPFSFSSNLPYTVTEMEILQALSPTDKKNYEAWISSNIKLINTPEGASSDPFRLEQGLKELIMLAKTKCLSLDIVKGDNIMARSNGEYVITDPYA